MASIEELRQQQSAFERVVAERLGLNPAEVLEGSIRIITDENRNERVEWTSTRRVEAGFMVSCYAEARRRG